MIDPNDFNFNVGLNVEQHADFARWLSKQADQRDLTLDQIRAAVEATGKSASSYDWDEIGRFVNARRGIVPEPAPVEQVAMPAPPPGHTYVLAETGYMCEQCEETAEADELESLYECNEGCGMFTPSTSPSGNHQCPTCNKFAAKVSDQGCPNCGEGECVEVTCVEDKDGERVILEVHGE